jgi:hypothetical protein
MKLECQSCLLQFDAVGAGPETKCPRCGSSNVAGAQAAQGLPSGPATASSGIAATIAQPMVPPVGMGGAIVSAPPASNPYGAPPNPYGAPPPAAGNPFGAQPQPPNPYGAPPNPYGAPQQPPPNPYGAPQQNPYGAPQPSPYAAPQNPYGAPQAAPYAPPMGGAYGQPMMGGFGAAPSGMMPYGNPQVDGEQRKAMIMSVISLLTFWPLAIAGFIYLEGSKDAMRRGDFATAMQKAKSSQTMGWVAIGITVALFALICFAGMAGSM